ncbi:NADP-dependent oxidoreductase domain-containing protein [Flagelloscypha sp. PMI_526]|nr:NADP-dependent oxidoreductase domain-containing protein [Flagelloscypha sp. PMI_526]
MVAPSYKLNCGLEIPAVALGTWQSKPEEVVSAVEYALKDAGYRHIDCAWAYSNEKQVGEGVAKSGIPRSEIFVTSKVWGTYHTRVEDGLNETLSNLGFDYLDLYLVHWPIALNPKGNNNFIPTRPDGSRDILDDWKFIDTWKQMEALVKKGKVKAIGVSNCSQMNLEKILSECEIVPAVNQLELHVYNPQHKLIEFCKSKGILPQAYSPLGSTGSPIIKDDTVDILAKGWVLLAKSITPSRITANLKGAPEGAATLTAEDIAKLDGVAAGGKQHRFVKPPWPVDLGFDDW